ncbi:MAG: hypothetical protein LBE57_00395 [Methanosarcinales archaeon]|jgi:hypothetical protein|nr:hypothetical protein [Methanosarcinales archaeon]
MQESEKRSKEEAEAAAMILEHVNDFGLFSFEREERREESAIAQAGQMLIAISVFSAVILMLVPILIEHTEIDRFRIYVFLAIVLSLLSVSFICAVLAQSKYEQVVSADINQIYQIIYEHYDEFLDRDDYLMLQKSLIGKIHQSKKKLNDKRVRLLFISQSILVFSIIVASLLTLLMYY